MWKEGIKQQTKLTEIPALVELLFKSARQMITSQVGRVAGYRYYGKRK